MPDLEPTPADKDVGIQSIKEVDESKCLEWALKDIENTRACQKNGWKFLRDKRACTMKN